MVSENALAALGGGGGGPQWQVDIPGLSQLVFSAGSYGLKQLALAGVDPHTIGCMLMIAEYTPACKEFRSVLSRTREQQRAERIWMYKIVEIGTSTNFLADQMLKTRAGENVVALLSASVSVMEEDSSIELLSALFDCANVSLDNIPGTKQLQSIRNNLAPLARKTGFREKLLHYHQFLLSLMRSRIDGLENLLGDPYDAIPAAAEIPIVIRLLHKITTSEDPYILIFQGLRGAAWTAAYASYVLGLHSCALDTERNPVPITGTYEEARVILDLSASPNKCELYLEGDLQELFAFDTNRVGVQAGWSIDCSVTNFVDLHHPHLRESVQFSRISNYAAMEAMNTLSNLSSSFDRVTTDLLWCRAQDLGPWGFVPYTKTVLSDLHFRSLRILSILGFRPAFTGYRFESKEECPMFYCFGHDTDPRPEYEETGEEYYDYQLEKKVKRKFLLRQGQYVPRGELAFVADEPLERLTYYLHDKSMEFDVNFSTLPAPLRSKLAQTISLAVNFASKLAFTDWDKSLRLMSVRAMSYREPYPKKSLESNFEGNMTEAIMLCSDSVEMNSLEKRLWSEDWIGLDLDGIVVMRNAARLHSITAMKGRYLSFCPGQIKYDGNQYYKVRADRIQTMTCKFNMDSKKMSSLSNLTPRDGFPSIRLRPLFTSSNDTIFIRLEVYNHSSLAAIVDCSIAARTVPDLLVSTPCSHGYFGQRSPETFEEFGTSFGFVDYLYEGLCFDDRETSGQSFGCKGGATLFYQHTSQNPCAQWLACQWQPVHSGDRCLRILQQDCCFPCIVSRLGKIIGAINESPESTLLNGYPVCIIAGMPENQHIPGQPNSLAPPETAHKPSLSASNPPNPRWPSPRSHSPPTHGNNAAEPPEKQHCQSTDATRQGSKSATKSIFSKMSIRAKDKDAT